MRCEDSGDSLWTRCQLVSKSNTFPPATKLFSPLHQLNVDCYQELRVKEDQIIINIKACSNNCQDSHLWARTQVKGWQISALCTLVPLALDPLALHPLTLHPLALDPLALQPLTLDPLALHPTPSRPTPSRPKPLLALHLLALHPLALHPLALHPFSPYTLSPYTPSRPTPSRPTPSLV